MICLRKWPLGQRAASQTGSDANQGLQTLQTDLYSEAALPEGLELGQLIAATLPPLPPLPPLATPAGPACIAR